MEEKIATKISENELEEVSGGYLQQTIELADFINAHGGHVRYDENMKKDIWNWFWEDGRYKKLGMSSVYFATNRYETGDNYVDTYKDGVGRRLSHEKFMQLLHETFD